MIDVLFLSTNPTSMPTKTVTAGNSGGTCRAVTIGKRAIVSISTRMVKAKLAKIPSITVRTNFMHASVAIFTWHTARSFKW